MSSRRLFVETSVLDAVLELGRDVRVEEDTRRAVLGHGACHRFVHDGVTPRLVGRRRRAGGDPEPSVGAGILTDDEFENGAHRFSVSASMREVWSVDALSAAPPVPGGERLDEPDRTQHEEVEPEQRDDRVEAASRYSEHRKPEDERRDAGERT